MGFEHESHVYLLGDAALTGPVKTPELLSGFGGAEYYDASGNSVQERTCKLFQLSTTAAAAWSGNVGNASTFLSSLKNKCKYSPATALANLVLETAQIQAPIDASPSATFVILFAASGTGSPTLFVFRSTNPSSIETVANGDIAVEGSGKKIGAGLAKNLLLHRAQNAIPHKDLLPLCLARLQHQGLVKNYQQEGVGGTFSGLSVGAEGVSWQPSVLYLFSKSSGGLDESSIMVRVDCWDGATVVRTCLPGPQAVHVLGPIAVERSSWVSAWSKNWMNEALSNALKDGDSIRYVVRGIIGPYERMVIVDRQGPNKDAVSFVYDAKGMCSIGCHPIVSEFLDKEPVHGIWTV